MDTESPLPALPDFSLPASTGQTLSLDSFRDKVPLAIVFLNGLEQDQDLLAAMNGALSDFGSERAQLLAVAPTGIDDVQAYAAANEILMPILADANGEMSTAFGGGTQSGQPWAVVGDAAGREIERFESVEGAGGVSALVEAVEHLGLGSKVESAGE